MIAEALNTIKAEISDQVTLVAVSKTKPVEDIQTAYNAGQRIFGENKIVRYRQIIRTHSIFRKKKKFQEGKKKKIIFGEKLFLDLFRPRTPPELFLSTNMMFLEDIAWLGCH